MTWLLFFEARQKKFPCLPCVHFYCVFSGQEISECVILCSIMIPYYQFMPSMPPSRGSRRVRATACACYRFRSSNTSKLLISLFLCGLVNVCVCLCVRLHGCGMYGMHCGCWDLSCVVWYQKRLFMFVLPNVNKSVWRSMRAFSLSLTFYYLTFHMKSSQKWRAFHTHTHIQ